MIADQQQTQNPIARPHTPDGTYTWQEPSGGTLGSYTCKVTVTDGRVTLWQTISSDGAYTTTANEYQLTLGGDHFLVTLATRIADLGHTGRMTFKAAEIDTPAELLPVPAARRGWGWIPATERAGA